MRKNTSKKLRAMLFVMLAAVLTLSFGMSAAAKEKEKEEFTYRTVIEVKDWGAAVTKVIVELGKPVPEGVVTEEIFEVHVSRSDARLADPFLGEGYRTVTDAYVADKDGEPIENGRGKYAVLEMETEPSTTLAQALNYDFMGSGVNDWVDYDYTITQVEDIKINSGVVSGIVADTQAGETRELIEDFSIREATYGDVTLSYADFVPEKDKQQNPLIIWLHGGGEGGTDATIPLAGNKAVAFATEEVQDYFDGAYVLVPQAPTRWMDGVNGPADGTSIYEEELMALIQDYVAANPDIDPDRIYVSGASNGGYMTLLLTRDYPDYFAAAVPVAEGLKDVLITDEDIEKLAQTPTWFVTAANDAILPPLQNTIPTYNRLIEAGAENVHMTLFDNVIDTTGLYNQEDGTPYEYNGHWSWIYFYNNVPATTIDGEEVTIMEWMAAQTN